MITREGQQLVQEGTQADDGCRVEQVFGRETTRRELFKGQVTASNAQVLG